jgi:hypothetical protein
MKRGPGDQAGEVSRVGLSADKKQAGQMQVLSEQVLLLFGKMRVSSRFAN